MIVPTRYLLKLCSSDGPDFAAIPALDQSDDRGFLVLRTLAPLETFCFCLLSIKHKVPRPLFGRSSHLRARTATALPKAPTVHPKIFSFDSRQYFDLSSVHAAFRAFSESMNFLPSFSKSASDCGI
jgi:hypothetical protein